MKVYDLQSAINELTVTVPIELVVLYTKTNTQKILTLNSPGIYKSFGGKSIHN